MRNFLFYSSDLRYTLRLLAKKPGFALLSALVLAGGMTVSLIAFTFSYTMFYKPIPVTNGESIYRLCAGPKSYGCRPFKAFEFAQLRQEISNFENVGVYQQTRPNIVANGESLRISATRTEWNMFQLTLTNALLGRTLQPTDHLLNAEPVIVIGFAYWHQHSNGANDIVGKTISVDGTPTQIVGVMPEGYLFPWASEVWLPIASTVLDPVENTAVPVNTFALLKDSVTVSAASAEIANLMSRIRLQYPVQLEEEETCRAGRQLDCDTGHISTLPMGEFGGFVAGIIIFLISLLTGSIFLLTCINVGTLLLARTNERLKDISIRVALGAPRKQLLLQSMGEGIVISLLGGLLAILLAGAIMELFNLLFISLSANLMSFWQQFHIDISTIVGALLIVVLTVLMTSAFPCWRIINGDFNAVMRDGTRGAIGLKSSRFSKSLVVISVVIVTVLVYIGTLAASYGLSIRDRLETAASSSDSTVSTRLAFDPERYSPAQLQQFYLSLEDRLLRDPNIHTVAFGSTPGALPIESEDGGAFLASGQPRAEIIGISGSSSQSATPMYEGRAFNNFDNDSSQPVAIVSRSLAERLWPEQSAIGQRLRVSPSENLESTDWRRVIGVANNTIITEGQLFSGNTDSIYIPLQQLGWGGVVINIPDSGRRQQVIDTLRRAVIALDADIPPFRVTTGINSSGVLVAFDMGLRLIIGTALFAFLVALVGIYGLTQNSVQLATQEIGTRRALGATDREISRSFLLRGSKQLLIGFIVAMLITSPVTYILITVGTGIFANSMLFSAITVVVSLYLATLLAIYHPIRKILRMEPSESLRYE